MSTKKHVYVHFPKLDIFLEEPSVAAAAERIRQEYPAAAFSDWQRIGEAEIQVAWADVGRQFRHLMGEDSRLAEPDAFVLCQDKPLREIPVSA